MPAAKKPSSVPAVKKIRLDRLLVDKSLTETRHKAQATIMAGLVMIDGKRMDKAGALVNPSANVLITGPAIPFVGRGGLKLAAALDHFALDVCGQTFLDIGSSTGGFIDCLFQRGAVRVHAVDVGSGQLDWRLRQDSRVHLLEGVNARYLTWELIGEVVEGISVDVSFISVTMILPRLVQFCRTGTRLLILVKPQFEVGKGEVGKGGIVRDPLKHLQSLSRIRDCAARLGFQNLQDFPCPVLGAAGNQEFLLTGIYSATSAPAN